MRTQGEGGQKTVKFCGRPLWMAPNVMFPTTIIITSIFYTVNYIVLLLLL